MNTEEATTLLQYVARQIKDAIGRRVAESKATQTPQFWAWYQAERAKYNRSLRPKFPGSVRDWLINSIDLSGADSPRFYLPSPDDGEIIAATLYVMAIIALAVWLCLWHRAG